MPFFKKNTSKNENHLTTPTSFSFTRQSFSQENGVGPDSFLPTEEIIKLSRKGGADFGSGNPNERIRYFIKLGILPYTTKKLSQNSSSPTGHLPAWTIKRLIEITELNKKGLTFPQIAQKLKNKPEISKPDSIEQSKETASQPRVVVTLSAKDTERAIQKRLEKHEENLKKLIEDKFKAQAQVVNSIQAGTLTGMHAKKFSIPRSALVALATFSLITSGIFISGQKLGYLTLGKNTEAAKTEQDIAKSGSVLAATSEEHQLYIDANLEVAGTAIFEENITAPNVVYSVTGGTGIAVTGGQNPVVSLDSTELVTSVNDVTGAISLQGSGGTTISEADGTITITSSSSGITSEADTLSSVTGRGSTTSTALTLNGNVTFGGTLTSSTLLTLDPTTYVSVGTGTPDNSDIGAGDLFVEDDLEIDGALLVGSSAGNNGQCLLSSGANTTPTWGACAGGASSFDITADSGTDQTIDAGDTFTIAGGTNIATVVSATDTITINLDDSITLAGDIAVNGDDITSDGTLTLDATTDIRFDADGADIIFLDGGATVATFTNSSTDLTLDIAGGDLLLADADTINIGGNGDDVAFNAIGDDTANAGSVNSDNDLYIEDDLEVDGTIFGALTGNVTGNADTATALAANGANCSAGTAPLGVDASGAAESCTDFEEDLSNSAGLAAALSDETGSSSGGLAVFNNAPTIISPTITTSPTAAGATWTDLGTVTTADINGGTIDGVTIGGSSAAAGTFTTLTASSTATFNGDTTIGNAAGDALTITSEIRGASPLTFEGSTNDDIYTIFAITDPTTSNKTITFPNASGTVAVSATAPIAISAAGNISLDQSANYAWTGTHSWTNTITNTGTVQNIALTLGADADNDIVSAINIDATSAATGDADILMGINIANLTSADSNVIETALRIGEDWDNLLELEGATNDGIETYLRVTDPDSADKIITFPNASGTVAVSASSPISLSALGDISCSTCVVSGGTIFTLDGDDATTETVSQGDTLVVAGGTNGIDTGVSATDTVTLNLDTTEIGSTTFGSGSGLTWTFDVGATDPTLAFASDQITATAATLVLSGTSTLTASSLTTITGGATAIDFTEFDVSGSTGAITINDTGDAGSLTVEGSVFDINSLDFTGAGAITTGSNTSLTITPGGTGDVIVDTDSDTTLTLNGGGDGVDSLVLTDGDILVSDGDLDLSGGDFNVALDAGDNASIAKGAATSATAALTVTNTTAGSDTAGSEGLDVALTVSDYTDDNAADTHVGLDLLATLNFDDAGTDDNLYGIRIQNLGGTAAGGAEYGLYQAGTAWDFGIYAEDAVHLNSTLAVGGNTTLTGDLAINGDDLTSDGDLTINAADGDVIFADADVINIGGNGNDVAFNAIGDDTANAGSVNSDNDLYIEDDLEVDGTIFGALTGNVAGSATDLNCTDCINATEIEDIYLLNSGDSITGTLTFDGVATDITTDTDEALTIVPNGTGDVIIDTDSDTTLTLNGGGDGVDSLVLTDGDILISDGDFDLSGGDFNITLDTGDSASFTASSNTTAANGAFDFVVSSTTDNNRGIDLAYTTTAATAVTLYGTYGSFTNSTALNADVSPTYYGIYQTASKSGTDGADTNNGSDTTKLFAIAGVASNTAATSGGDAHNVRQTYGGYFSATGSTAGTDTTTAYGIYTTAASADTNYSLYAVGQTVFNPNTSTAAGWKSLEISGSLGNYTGASYGIYQDTDHSVDNLDPIYYGAFFDMDSSINLGAGVWTHYGFGTDLKNSTNAANVSVGALLQTSSSSTTADTQYGLRTSVTHTGDTTSGSDTKSLYGIYSTANSSGADDTSGTTLTYGGYFSAIGDNSGAATTNAYGIYVASSGADNNTGIYITAPTASGITVDYEGFTLSALTHFAYQTTGTITKDSTLKSLRSSFYNPTVNVSVSGALGDVGFQANGTWNYSNGVTANAGVNTSFLATPTLKKVSGTDATTAESSTGFSHSYTTAITAGSSFTLAEVTGFHADHDLGVTGNGSGVTISNLYGLRVDNSTNSGTITRQYGAYISDLTSGTTDYGIYLAGADNFALYSAADDVQFTLGAADSVTIDGSSTASTQTNGVLDINVTSLTSTVAGINLSYTSTSTVSSTTTQYGLSSSLSNATASGAVSNNLNLYSVYGHATKTSDATDNASYTGTQTLIGVYGLGHNAALGGASSTRNTYGGWFSAADTSAGGTNGAYGVFATTTGGDTNLAFSGYFLNEAPGRVYINSTTNASTTTSGALDLDVTSATSGNSGFNLSYTSTHTGTANQYGGYGAFTNAQNLSADTEPNYYGIYQTVSKSGTDTANSDAACSSADCQTDLFGIVGVASNTSGTDDVDNVRNTYGGYFSATGNTNSTSTTYGIYAAAGSGDTNYAGYFSGDVFSTKTIAAGTAPAVNSSLIAGTSISNILNVTNGVFVFPTITDSTTNHRGIAIASPAVTGSVTNSYGIFIANQTGGTNNYGVYVAGANSYGLWIDSGTSRFDGDIIATLSNANSSTEAVCGTSTSEGAAASTLDDCTTSVNADYAEVYPVENGIDYGDIVTIGPETINTQHNAVDQSGQVVSIGNYNLPILIKSSAPYQSTVVGVTSNNWSDFSSTGRSSVPDEHNPKPVALVGRVPVKVTNENGSIHAGDLLTTSSTPGHAMKADPTKGSIIGKALEDFDGDSGIVMMFVETSTRYNLANALKGTDLETLSLTVGSGNTTIDALGNIATTGAIEAAGGLFAVDGLGNITAQDIDVIGNLQVAGTLETASITAPEGQDLSISLGDSAGSNNLKILDSIGNAVFKLNSTGNATLYGPNAYLAIPQGYICVNDSGVCDVINPQNGTVYADNFSTTGTADLAEYFPTVDDEITNGDIVALDPNNSENIIKSSGKYQSTLLGIISSEPGISLNSTEVGGKPLALGGRVPTKVNLENGEIKAGDPITSSSTPGVGMKATEAGRVIGIALEDLSIVDSQSTIVVFVNPSWYLPSEALAQKGTSAIQTLAQNTNPDGTLHDNDNQLSMDDSRVKEYIDREVSEQIESLIASGRLNPASYQSSPQPSNINAPVPTPQIVSPTPDIAGASCENNQVESSASAESTVSALSTDCVIEEGEQVVTDTQETLEKLDELLSTTNISAATLEVSGNTNLAQTQVAGTFSQDGTFIIDYGRQLNVLASTLFIQNDPFAGDLENGILVDIGAGNVTIDKTGSIRLTGTLFAQNIETEELTLNISDKNAKSAGTATLTRGQTQTTIFTTLVKHDAKILITPTTPTGGKQLYVANKAQFEGFTVAIDGLAATNTIEFDWLIVNTDTVSQAD